MLLDLSILILIFIFAINGFRRGFLVLAGRLLILAASFAVSLLLLGPTAKILDEVPFLKPIIETLNEKVIRPLLPAAGTISESLTKLGLPKPLEALLRADFPNQESALAEVWPQLSSTLAHYLITAVVFFLSLTLISLLIRTFISIMSDILDHVPVVGGLNHLSGFLLGAIHGSLIVICFILALGFLAPFIPSFAQLQSRSQIVAYFYEQDLIAKGMQYFLKSI